MTAALVGRIVRLSLAVAAWLEDSLHLVLDKVEEHPGREGTSQGCCTFVLVGDFEEHSWRMACRQVVAHILERRVPVLHVLVLELVPALGPVLEPELVPEPEPDVAAAVRVELGLLEHAACSKPRLAAVAGCLEQATCSHCLS